MAVHKVICGVSLLQMILSLVTLGLCSKHYHDTMYIRTEISHVAVMFAMRALPTMSLLACGIVGLITSCLNSATARVVFNTMTMQTACSLLLLVWYFSYRIYSADIPNDRIAASKCLTSTVISLTTCVVYIAYTIVKLCMRLKRDFLGDLAAEDQKDAENAVSKTKIEVHIIDMSDPCAMKVVPKH